MHGNHGDGIYGDGHLDHHGNASTWEALHTACSHGGNHLDMHIFNYHHGDAHLHNTHFVHLGVGNQDTTSAPASKSSQDDPDEIRTFVVHVANHAQSAIRQEIEHNARMHDLLRIDLFRPNFDAIDELQCELTEWSPPMEPHQQADVPRGYFPGATGRTRIIRQYWQVGNRPGLLVHNALPVFDTDASTFIELSLIEWHYNFTGDYETKLAVRVISLPVWDEVAGTWSYKRSKFKLHQRAAISVCENIFVYLTALAPTQTSKLLRNAIINRADAAHHDKEYSTVVIELE